MPSDSPIWSCPPGCRYGLRMLVPAVENAIAGNAYRPGDVVPTRKGPDHRGREHRRGGADRAERRAGGRRHGCARSDDRLSRPSPARHAWRWAPTCLRCSPTTRRWPTASRTRDATSATRVWRMPLHAPYRELIESRGRGPHERDEPALRRGDSPPHCSCRHSCRTRSRGHTSTSWRGRLARSRPGLWGGKRWRCARCSSSSNDAIAPEPGGSRAAGRSTGSGGRGPDAPLRIGSGTGSPARASSGAACRLYVTSPDPLN